MTVRLRRKVVREYNIKSLVEAPVTFWRINYDAGLTCIQRCKR